MPFHCAAYRASFNSAAETEIAVVQDNVIPISNNRLLPPEDYGVIAVWSGGTTMDFSRINTPSLRNVNAPPLFPVTRGTVPGSDPNVDDKRGNPLKINALEEIMVTVLQSSGGAEMETVVLFLSQGFEPAPRGNIYSIRGTGTTTVAAGAWSPCAMTWETNLPNGLFAVVGMQAQAATVIAARLNIVGQTPRPGCLGNASAGLRTHLMFAEGQLGVWGRFRQTAMPIPEFLCAAADAAETVYMQFIQVG